MQRNREYNDKEHHKPFCSGYERMGLMIASVQQVLDKETGQDKQKSNDMVSSKMVESEIRNPITLQ
jgi:hypothetical protein